MRPFLFSKFRYYTGAVQLFLSRFMLDEQTLALLRKTLETERAEIEKEVLELGEEDTGDEVPGQKHRAKFPNYGDDAIDSNDTSPNEVADFAANANVVSWLEQRMKDLEAALERMDENTYGVCTVCKKGIDMARLEANPASTTCSDDAVPSIPRPA